MRLLTESLKVTNLPFVDHLIVSSKETVDVDPSDDLKRETALYVCEPSSQLALTIQLQDRLGPGRDS